LPVEDHSATSADTLSKWGKIAKAKIRADEAILCADFGPKRRTTWSAVRRAGIAALDLKAGWLSKAVVIPSGFEIQSGDESPHSMV
jgi:hypothetical protein